MRYRKTYKNFFIIAILLLFAILTIGCGAQTEEVTEIDNIETQDEPEPTVEQGKSVQDNPIVTITMDNDTEIIIELYPNIAPNTVNNFVSLIQDEVYNGLIFHRVMPGFMIQGGDPAGNGTGGPGYAIKGEFSSNDFGNNLKHYRGVVSMARTQDPDSAGSQFFIMVDESPELDGEYAAFGEVIDGMEVVDQIVSAETDSNDKPLEDYKMKTVEVDTKGHEYPDPEVE